MLRCVLSSRGTREKVVDLFDALDWGPISSSIAERSSWFDSNAPSSMHSWKWLTESEERFRNSIAADQERLVWISPACAAEQAGLYWYLDRFGDHGAQFAILEPGCGIIEVPVSIGELGEAEMSVLFDSCPRVALDPSHFPTDTWHTLVAENALLRMVKDGRLESAPENFFDRYLMEHCPHRWTEWSRVVGEAMMSMWEAGHRTGLYLLDWRLRELVRSGQVECQGELPPVDCTRGSVVRAIS
jgi:hypothetical protein